VGITAVTLVIWALNGLVPASASGGLYVLAILPVATRFGFGPALVTAASSALVFDFLFFPPYFSLALQDPQDEVIVLIFAVIAGVVSVLAGRARQRTREAEGLAREQAALRRVATLVARAAAGGGVRGGSRGGRAADGLRVDAAVPVRPGRRGDGRRRLERHWAPACAHSVGSRISRRVTLSPPWCFGPPNRPGLTITVRARARYP
jgi:hypothetical protein